MRDLSGELAADLFDPVLLEDARVPADLPLDGGRLVFLWQPPSAATLARLQRRCPGVPILVGRFESETLVYEAKLPYWCATDFFPLRSMMGFELAGLEARGNWRGPEEPTYLGMSLIDGDIARFGRWFELVAAAAMFVMLRRVAPRIEVLTDWMGARLVKGIGLRVGRLRQADWTDPNWPIRRWVREHVRGVRGVLRRWQSDPAEDLGAYTAGDPGADIVFLLAGWVETRLLAGFPIEPLAEQGHRCLLWVSRRSAELEALIERTRVRCEPLVYPSLPASRTTHLEREVAAWCDHAAGAGYFAPLRGALARCVVMLMGWPRWAPKLVAMHRLLTARLERERPRLFIAPAEKDWSAYCGHHAARRLGITTVGCRHGAWPPGSFPERYDHRYFFPPAPRHILAFTPGDEALCRTAVGVVRPDTVLWRGNPRLDKSQTRVPDSMTGDSLRVLVATHGTGHGSPTAVRKRTRPLNVQLISTLADRLGDRVRVRAHPWDSADNFPSRLRPLFVPHQEDLNTQLNDYAAVVTTYSTIAIDAAASGRPVFLWDYGQLGYDRGELAVQGGLVAIADLGELCDAVARFADDSHYREMLLARAARFPAYLRETLPGLTDDSMTSALAQWLGSLAGSPPAPEAGTGRGQVAQAGGTPVR